MEALEEAEIFLILLIDVDWYKWKKIPEIILTIPWRFRIIRFVDSESMTASVKGHRGVGRWPRWATAYRAWLMRRAENYSFNQSIQVELWSNPGRGGWEVKEISFKFKFAECRPMTGPQIKFKPRRRLHSYFRDVWPGR